MEINLPNALLLSLVESGVAFYVAPQLFPGGKLTTNLISIASFNVFLLLSYKFIFYPFLLHPLKHLPKPKGFLPILGHGYVLFQRPQGEPHLKMMRSTPNDGLIFTYGIFHTTRLIVTSPAALADVLVHRGYDFEKIPGTRNFLRKFLGDGLLTIEGEEHAHFRKHIQPAFHFRYIKELYPIFWAKSVEFCNTMKATLAQDSSQIIELGHYATQVTLDIIGLAGLGRDIASLKNDDDELVKTYEEILHPTKEKALFFILHIIFPAWFINILPWYVYPSCLVRYSLRGHTLTNIL